MGEKVASESQGRPCQWQKKQGSRWTRRNMEDELRKSRGDGPMATQSACMPLDDVPAATIVIDHEYAQASDFVDPPTHGRVLSGHRQRSLGTGNGEAGSVVCDAAGLFCCWRARRLWL